MDENSAVVSAVKTIQCSNCGKTVERTGYNQKRCEECAALPQFGSAPRVRKFRASEREKKEAKVGRYNSTVEISRRDAREILVEERGIRNPHVVDVVLDLADVAAKHYKLPFNTYLITHGLRVQLAALEKKQQLPAPEISDEEVPGEIINRRDLYALWDFGYWRQPESFEEFFAQRRRGKSDAYWLGREILGKDFEEKPHGDWANFFPRLNPDGLKPGYSQKEAQQWLARQSDRKEFLFLASRNAFKSSFVRVWILTALLCLPDVRVLCVSGTRELMEDSLRELRGYLQTTPEAPSRFAQLFPDFVIAAGEGSATSFSCPLAHLGLAQTTIKLSSLESVSTGSRFDIGVFDDLINDKNSATEDLRLKAIRTFDALLKLKEIGAGYVFTIGTPWAVGDLYQTLIERDEEDPDHALAVRIDPAWRVKQSARHKSIEQLVESDIEQFLFPSRLNWKFLQSELRKSKNDTPPYSFFRTQNLCEWVSAEDGIRLYFDEDVLRAHVRQPAFFDGYERVSTVISVDPSRSIAKTADFSAISVNKILKKDGKHYFVVWTVEMDRWRLSELAFQIIKILEKYQHESPKVVIEKDTAWEGLRNELQRVALLKGFALPYIYWKEPDAGGRDTKFLRMKNLEAPLEAGQFWMIAGNWNDPVIAQFVKLANDGKPAVRSNSTRKDDAPDSISNAYVVGMPRDVGGDEAEELKKAEEEAQAAARRAVMYQRYFGNESIQRSPEPLTPPPPTDPLSQARQRLFGSSGIWK